MCRGTPSDRAARLLAITRLELTPKLFQGLSEDVAAHALDLLPIFYKVAAMYAPQTATVYGPDGRHCVFSSLASAEIAGMSFFPSGRIRAHSRGQLWYIRTSIGCLSGRATHRSS